MALEPSNGSLATNEILIPHLTYLFSRFQDEYSSKPIKPIEASQGLNASKLYNTLKSTTVPSENIHIAVSILTYAQETDSTEKRNEKKKNDENKQTLKRPASSNGNSIPNRKKRASEPRIDPD
ncbi:hypothetical protein TNIN_171061 [Trichonephila inaurata madagascariensis]|uniref:Uncharacterized protein n=1 Tax=Trichonephila inaurata madagascariensis TaxID=2747483 RepID=A0A8X6XY10_9ARAC|nr:hypothetical protein TNIN_171061 [Trichonephila inaurata madagascariensis]